MEGEGKILLQKLEPPEVRCSAAVESTCAEPWGIGEDTKATRHRSVQQKLESIYPLWKQLIKEPWKDRGGLERFEYGTV